VLTVYGIATLLWSAARLPETLPAAERKPFSAPAILDAFKKTLTDRQTLGYALAAAGISGAIFGYVLCAQQIFTGVYGLGRHFPLAFAAIAIAIAISGFLNSRLVVRLGMRVISHSALVLCLLVAIAMFVAARTHLLPLSVFMTLSALMMFSFGFMFANFTALALEPQRANAGTASSLYGSITTLLGIGAGAMVGQAYDGTVAPFATGFLACVFSSLVIVAITEKGRLFQPHHAAAK